MSVSSTVTHGRAGSIGIPGVPALGEHATIVGKNGSGKSTTATIVLRRVKSVGHDIFIIDSKGERIFEAIADVITGNPKEALEARGCVVYRPEKLLAMPRYLDAMLDQIYDSKRNLYLYIDEMNRIANTPQPPVGLTNALMRGRRRYVGARAIEMSVLMGTQRPSRIPRAVLTEASHFYIHQLKPRDLKSIAEDIGHDEIMREPPIGHKFYYYNEKTDRLSPLTQWRVSIGS